MSDWLDEPSHFYVLLPNRRHRKAHTNREWSENWRLFTDDPAEAERGGWRRVGSTEVGTARVSTVWLMGIDHGWGRKVLLYETMVFDAGDEEYVERYGTWPEAEAGHQRAVQWTDWAVNWWHFGREKGWWEA